MKIAPNAIKPPASNPKTVSVSASRPAFAVPAASQAVFGLLMFTEQTSVSAWQNVRFRAGGTQH
jgi:hypothetical protein